MRLEGKNRASDSHVYCLWAHVAALVLLILLPAYKTSKEVGRSLQRRKFTWDSMHQTAGAEEWSEGPERTHNIQSLPESRRRSRQTSFSLVPHAVHESLAPVLTVISYVKTVQHGSDEQRKAFPLMKV